MCRSLSKPSVQRLFCCWDAGGKLLSHKGTFCTRLASNAVNVLIPSPRGDKVSMLTHAYLHKTLRNIKVTICNHQVDSPYCLWSDVYSGDLQPKKSVVIHVTECPY